MFKLDLEKAEGPEIKLPTSTESLKKTKEFQRNIHFFFIDYAKAFDCVDHNKLWKILKELGIPDHLTCLLRNLYAGQEATVRTGHGITDWFQIGKRVCPGCHRVYLTYRQTSVQFNCLSCPTLCDPMNRSTPGLPVHHQLESNQTHVHRVDDAIQPSHPIIPFSSCPQSFLASGSFPMSQLFASSGQSIGVSASASVLPMNTQD